MIIFFDNFFGIYIMATYYISSSAGSDSNTPTQAQSTSSPWATLLYAQTVANDGDTLLLRQGDSWNNSSGVCFNVGVNISSYASGSPTTQPYYYSTSTGISLISFTGIDGWSVSNLSFGLPTASIFTGMSCISCQNTDGLIRTRPISITNCTISGGWGGITFGNNAYGSLSYYGITSQTSNIIVSGNNIMNGAIYSIAFWSTPSTGVAGGRVNNWNNINVTNNTCQYTAGFNGAPRVPGHIVLVSVNSGICNNNFMNYCGSTNKGGGPIFTSTSNGILVENNVISNVFNGSADGFGFDCDTYSQNIVVQYNIIYNCDGGLLEIYPSASTTGNVFRWNVGINCCRRGYNNVGLFQVQGGSNNNGGYQIYNNTAISCTSDSIGIFSDGDTPAANIYNNLLFLPNGCTAVNYPNGISSKFFADGNYYWLAGVAASGNNTLTNFTITGVTYPSLSSWQAATNQDAHSQAPGGFAPFTPVNPVGLTLNQNQISQIIYEFAPYIGSNILSGGLALTGAPYNYNVGTRDILGNTLSGSLPIGAIAVGRNYTSAIEVLAHELQPLYWYRGAESSGALYVGDSTLWAGVGTYNVGLNSVASFISGDFTPVANFPNSNYATVTNNQMTNGGTLSCTGFTVCGWVEPTSESTGASYIACGNSNISYLLYLTSSSGLGLNVYDGTNHIKSNTAPLTINNNQPYFVAGSCSTSGGFTNLFINGVPYGVSYTNSGALAPIQYNYFSMGGNGYNYFNGKISNVMFFKNTLLNQAQLQELYLAGIAMGYNMGGSPTGSTTTNIPLSIQPFNTVNVDSVVLSDGGNGGTFFPSATVSYSNSAATQNITYSNSTSGYYNITATSADSGIIFNSPFSVIIFNVGGGGSSSSGYPFYPTQFYGGPPFYITPATGSPTHILTGGVIFAGGVLQNNNLFDSNLGILNYPYLGIRNAYSDNRPVQVTNELGGITTAVSDGLFGTIIQDQYVILTFTTKIAGLYNSTLVSPSRYGTKSINIDIGWVDTYQINRGGGWWYLNGLPMMPTNSRDYIGKEQYPGSYAIPNRLTSLPGGKSPTTQSISTKND